MISCIRCSGAVLPRRFGFGYFLHVVGNAHRALRDLRLRRAFDIVAQRYDPVVVGERAAVFFEFALRGFDLLVRIEQERFAL